MTPHPAASPPPTSYAAASPLWIASRPAALTRDDPASWKGHVGFYLRHDDENVYLFGGNQLEEVRALAYPLDTVLGYRWPA